MQNGLNFIGDTTVQTGLGEATRSTLDAIIDAQIPVSYIEYNAKYGQRNHITRYDDLKQGSRYDVNLIPYNMYDYHTLDSQTLNTLTQGKYTIVHWVWEQPTIPNYLHNSFYSVDEIWTPSRYCQQAYASIRPLPVHVVPYPIHVPVSNRLSKTQLGVPDGRFVFLFSFAAPSVVSRKNPIGLIEAFRNAFPKDSPQSPYLILKVHQLEDYPEFAIYLKSQLETINSVLIEEPLSRQEMNDLLASVDCYVSLHRSEGFGLGMAEAMALGKPVIATHYSGNADFMNETNSFPVRYSLRPMTLDDFVYQPDKQYLFDLGHLWAEPDLDHASELMQVVVGNPELAAERGHFARETIQQYYSPTAVANIIRQRLTEIMLRGSQSTAVDLDLAKIDEITPETLNTALQDVNKTFQEWDYRRVPEIRNRVYRLPALGYVLRTIERVINLGKMWADLKFLLQAQQMFNTAIKTKLDYLQHFPHIKQLRADMRLHNQDKQQISQQIEQLNAEIASLKQEIEQLREEIQSLRS